MVLFLLFSIGNIGEVNKEDALRQEDRIASSIPHILIKRLSPATNCILETEANQ